MIVLGSVISQDFGHLRKSTTWFTLERELKEHWKPSEPWRGKAEVIQDHRASHWSQANRIKRRTGESAWLKALNNVHTVESPQ